jgi:hypothetical protein
MRPMTTYRIIVTCIIGISIMALSAFGTWGIVSHFMAQNDSSSREHNLSRTAVENSSEPSETIPPTPEPVRLMFVGDIMTDRGVKNSVLRNFDGDYTRLFEHVGLLKEADITFGNLEGPVSDTGRNVGSIYSFRMDPMTLPALKGAGFDVLSLANNHAGDWSLEAFVDTLTRAAQEGIVITGAGRTQTEARGPQIIERHGIRFGFLGVTDVGPNWLAATDTRPGIVILEEENFTSLVQEAVAQVDILIVTPHWGPEYKPHTERQERLARMAIDAGARLVIGHHPHVIQSVEYYGNGIIAYSLGNFIFDQYFSPETMEGLLLDITYEPLSDTFSLVEWRSPLARTYQPQPPERTDTTPSIVSPITLPRLCPEGRGTRDDLALFPLTPDRGIDDRIPYDLIPMENRLEVQTTASCLRKDAGMALQELAAHAFRDGMYLVMTSGFRDFETQRILYERNQKNNPDQFPPSVARPGHSEHQLGTTVDFKTRETVHQPYSVFGTTPEYAWLRTHGATYGFVQSYPMGKESETGYIAEPWHWRYVGVEHAQRIVETGTLPVTYLQNLAKQNPELL